MLNAAIVRTLILPFANRCLRLLCIYSVFTCLVYWPLSSAEQAVLAQEPFVTGQGDVVPRDVRDMVERGLQYLMESQEESGGWRKASDPGSGTTGLALLAFLASGEDPNFGKYSVPIRKALRSIISAQDGETGYIGSSMYHHGFAMLALAEAYGAVDEKDLWNDVSVGPTKKRSLGEALELCVRSAVTSQNANPLGAWRYSPSGRDADTSVSGAVLVGLLAARNAGIEVPDKSIDRAVQYYTSMTGSNGIVGYSGGLSGFGESIARSSIACLIYSIAKRKDLKQFASVENYVTSNLTEQSNYPEYARYYQAQALFQVDLVAWDKWNRMVMRELKSSQKDDGSFEGQLGPTNSTSLAILALALNYRFLPIYER